MRKRKTWFLLVVMLACAVGAQAQGLDKTTKKLVKQLDHRDAKRRAEAATLLGKMKSEAAVPQLIEALEDPAWSVRSAVAGALWRLGSPAADAAKVPLEARLNTDESGKVRVNAAGALWRLGVSTRELIPHLKVALDDEDAYARVDAADMLLDMRVAPKEVIPTLEQAMRAEPIAVRERVANQVIERSPLPGEFEPLLITALADSEWSIRLLAAMALSGVEGGASEEAQAALRKATKDRSKVVRNAAQEALATLP